ncbi:MAG: hypothetical protein II843_03300 [Alphaproteobacteria bacterium]|nr:hypothetical protein [Alphaproteobacteria bacterium]
MRERVCKISLFSAILACVSTMPVDAAVKTKNSNRSYAGAYQQLNAMYGQQGYATETTTAAAANLPVMVTDEKLANSIVNNEVGAPSVSDLEACSMIYANGDFKWGTPEYGINRDPQCIAVVELRDANTNAVLASTTVGAGQSIKCNIDSFPGGSYNMSALSRVELPADTAPTMEDVVAVMNEEQKQNAGLKIAAGAIIAGVAGNLLAKQDTSKTGDSKIPLGTGKTQLLDTAVGAATGAGIMAASSYTGKVAGDTIKSTAVNAASGMLIGNMMAGANGGDSVITTTKCSVNGIEYDCVVGNYEEYGKDISSENGAFYIVKPDGSGLKQCNSENICTPPDKIKRIGNIVIKTESVQKTLDEYKKDKDVSSIERWIPSKTGKMNEFEKETSQTGNDDMYFEIVSAKEIKNSKHAYAVFENTKLNKIFGYQNWDELKSKNPKIYNRYVGGGVGDLIAEDDALNNFKPSLRDADDGALIDLSNQARAKGTIVGTAAGGALGGFAGYQGAQTEVSERWVSALREYEDSLSNFVCFTGGRYLSKYNDYADIPALKTNK